MILEIVCVGLAIGVCYLIGVVAELKTKNNFYQGIINDRREKISIEAFVESVEAWAEDSYPSEDEEKIKACLRETCDALGIIIPKNP